MRTQGMKVGNKCDLQVYHYYMNLEFGAFMVRHISENGILVTILDTYGESKRRSYLTFTDSVTEIDKETFDNLYKKHTYKGRLMGNKYGTYAY